MMKTQMQTFLSLGVDVSSQTLDVYIMREDETGKHKIFDNSKKGVLSLKQWLENNDFRGKIVMESTGRYHEYPAVVLYESGFEVYVINPLRAKKYHTSQVRKLKTDKNDAKILAEMGIKEKVLDKFSYTAKEVSVKKKMYFIKSLEKKLQELESMIKTYTIAQENLGNELTNIEENIQGYIKEIQKSKKKLQQEVIKQVFQESDINACKAKEILVSISGVSEYYAALVYYFYSRNNGKKAKSWIAYSGLEVSISESGTWKSRGKLSKRGNKYLRKRNYSAGWGAIMNDAAFREYYDHLKKKGRCHVEALTIIGRKILRIAYSCLKYEQKFKPQILQDILKNF